MRRSSVEFSFSLVSSVAFLQFLHLFSCESSAWLYFKTHKIRLSGFELVHVFQKKCLWLKIYQSNAADVMWTGLFCLFCVFYLKIWFKNITLYPADTWSSPHFVISKSGFLTYSTDRITLWFNHLSMKGFKMTITLKYI